MAQVGYLYPMRYKVTEFGKMFVESEEGHSAERKCTMLDDLLAQAKTLDSRYQRDMKDIANDDALTPTGKVEKAAQLDAQRRTQVAALQAEAQRRIDAAKVTAAQDMAAAKAAALDEKRKLLGDAVLADIYRRRLERLDSDGIARLYENAATPWEKAVIGEYGMLALEERTAAPDASRADFVAWQTLRQVDAPGKDDAIQQAETVAQQLDLAAYRQGMADRLNVSAQHVPDPF